MSAQFDVQIRSFKKLPITRSTAIYTILYSIALLFFVIRIIYEAIFYRFDALSVLLVIIIIQFLLYLAQEEKMRNLRAERNICVNDAAKLYALFFIIKQANLYGVSVQELEKQGIINVEIEDKKNKEFKITELPIQVIPRTRTKSKTIN